MSKICSNCDFNNEENAKFCLKCGNSLGSNNTQEISCSSCGSSSPIGYKFCKNCGSSLESNTGDSKINQGNIPINNQSNHSYEVNCPYCKGLIPSNAEKCKHCGEWVKKSQSKIYNQIEEDKSYTITIIVGYIISFLGGWLGIIIALYLLSRKNKNAKIHGGIMILLAIIMILVWLGMM